MAKTAFSLFTPEPGGRMPIRIAGVSDSQPLASFLSRACDDEREYFDATSEREIKDSLQRGDTWLVIEDETATIMGCVCGYREPRADVGRVRQLAVEAAYRRNGLGRELMHAAEQQLQALGCRRVIVGVLEFKANELIPFYQRFGYVMRFRSAPITPPKKRVEMIVMAKEIVTQER